MSEKLDQNKLNSDWNYHPKIPLENNSIFRSPPKLIFFKSWILRNWLHLSEKVILVMVSSFIWYFFYPSLEQTKIIEFSWIFQIWVINLLLMILIAGGLHWYFYIIKGQDKRLKFDKRDQGKGKLWDFSNQVHDNMFWSLTSGIGQLTIFQSITMWLLANNYSPVNSFSSNPFWFLAFFLLIPIWSAFITLFIIEM